MLILVDDVTFSSLVSEVFIGPLRSVLVVDDQYPTWEEILNDRLDDATKDKALDARAIVKTWRTASTSIIALIEQFRSRSPGLIVDMHDAIDPTRSNRVNHLHQSDLLVLDYNLEGAESGLGGARAREILQLILSNKHFNLVIVHTGEEDLNEVFFHCLLASMTSCTSRFDEVVNQDLAQLDIVLDDLETGESFDRSLLAEKFGSEQYLSIREPNADLKKNYS